MGLILRPPGGGSLQRGGAGPGGSGVIPGGAVTFVMWVVVVVLEVSAVKVWELSRRPVGGLESP